MRNTLKVTGLSFLASLMFLAACSSTPSAVAPTQSQPVALQPAAKAEAVIADVGKGIKTPAKLSFSINLTQLPGFRTQASTAGTPSAKLTDLHTIKFYLIPSTTGSAPSAVTAGTGFTYDLNVTNQTNGHVDVTFTNVPANATGESYYVAVGGFNSATINAANNITNLNAPITDGTEGKYYVSTTGGLPDGCVRVTPVTYALSDTAALGIPLKLLDAISPILDSDVTVTKGDEITGSPSGSGS